MTSVYAVCKHLRIHLANSVLRVDLHRPKHLNAFNDGLYMDIQTCFKAAKLDQDVRAIVLTGGPDCKHFTAGLDRLFPLRGMGDPTFTQLIQQDLDVGRKVKRWQDAFSSIEDCDKPVIALVHGACIGAGVDLVTACDLRYCTQDASFSVKEVDIGIAADLGTLQRLIKVVGHQSTLREWCFTGRKVPSDEALKVGLVSQVYPNWEEMLKEGMDLASRLAAKSPVALLSTKRVLNHSRDHSVADGLDFVAAWNAGMLQTSDCIEAMTAALTKRAPIFPKL